MSNIQHVESPSSRIKYVHFLTNILCLTFKNGNFEKNIAEVILPAMARHKCVIQTSVYIH